MHNRFKRFLKANMLACLFIFASQISIAQPSSCYQSTPFFVFDGMIDTIIAALPASSCVAMIPPQASINPIVTPGPACMGGNFSNCNPSNPPTFLPGISSHNFGDNLHVGTTAFLFYEHLGTVDSMNMGSTITFPIRDTFCLQIFAFESTPPTAQFDDSSTPADTTLVCGTPPLPIPTVTAFDNCPGARILGPTITDNRTMNGTCDDMQFEIIRTWVAIDSSGNTDTLRQTLRFRDSAGATFTTPRDTTVDCQTSIDTSLLGVPTNVMDNCSPPAAITFTFTDIRDTLSCLDSVRIRRNWVSRDLCGNQLVQTQIILVIDTIPPTFILPRDTTVSCGTDMSPTLLGMPTLLMDNCDTTARFSFVDAFVNGACTNEGTINRTWSAIDTCGNLTELIQTISVIDTVGPTITIQAMDTTIQCLDGINADTSFTNWIDRNAGAMVTDNCTDPNDFTYLALNAGTSDMASLPDSTCGVSDTLRTQAVDFIVFDACGMSDTTRAVFTEIDTIAPIITSCFPDTIVGNAPGLCGATINFTPPVFTDNCNYDTLFQYSLDGAARVTVNPLANFDLFINVGQHQMTYYITDCGGNIDSCMFMVTVNDIGMPVVQCPSNISVSTDMNVCAADVTIPFPTLFADNCGFPGMDTIPSYFATGATIIGNTVFGAMTVATHTFNLGNTNISYFIEDVNGNADTCTFQISVVDNERPNAVCTPSSVSINPSGLVQGNIVPADIDAGSTDNCMIRNMIVQPNIIICDSIDRNVTVRLIVEDANSNLDTCTTFVRVIGEEPAPAFNFLCGSDTLFLFANPPAATTGFTYRWFGPNNTLISTNENPEITTNNLIQSGVYCVEIEGLTGCTSTGCVNVPLDLRPPQPLISGDAQVCWDTDDIDLTATPPQGVSVAVTYNWYEGIFPNGTFLTSTSVPSFSIMAPHANTQNMINNRCFYATTTINDCESQPSNIHCLDVVRPPTTIVANSSETVCENQPLQLNTFVNSNFPLTYDWTGPGFNSTLENPIVDANANPSIHNGNYNLIISLNGCPSNTAMTTVNVLDVPDGQPNITPLSQEVCVGNTFTICTNLTGVSSYRWTSPTGAEISTNDNCLTLTANEMNHNGTWTVRGIVSFSNPNIDCETLTSTPSIVEVNTFPQQLVAFANPAQVCGGGSVELQVTPILPGASYVWSGPNGVVGAAPTVTLNPIQQADEGTYCVMVTNDAGCTRTECTQVMVAPGVEVVSASNNGPNCFTGRTDVTLSLILNPPDDGTFTYRWTGPCGFVSTSSSPVVDLFDFENCRGTYCVEVTNGDGCVSNVECTTIDGLPPLPAPFITVAGNDPTFCAGDDICINVDSYAGFGTDVQYSWVTSGRGLSQTNSPKLQIPNAFFPIDSGLYFLSVNVDGCITSTSNFVTIDLNPIPLVNARADASCEGGQILLSSNFFPAGGTDVTFNWTTPIGSLGIEDPIINNADPNIHNGTYSLTVNRNGCEGTDDVEVVITEAPMMPVAVQTEPICLGSSGPLDLCLNQSSLEAGATYLWTDENGDTLGLTQNICLTLTDLSGFSEGNFPIFVTTINNGCDTRNPAPMVVEFTELPNEKADAGADFSICQDDELILSAAPINDGIGCWEYLGGLPGVLIENPCNSTTRVVGLPPGNNYDFLWSLSKGACENYATDTVEVTIFAVETAFAGNDIDTCATNVIQLNAQPSISGLGMWVQNPVQDSLGVIITDPFDPNTTVVLPGPSPSYFFTWVIPDEVCGGSSDQIIVKLAAANAFAGIDFDECGLGDAILNANPSSDDSGVWTSLDPDIEFIDPLEPSTVVENLQNGLNTLIWTIDGGICGAGSIDTLFIDYSLSPIAINDSATVPFGGTVQVMPGSNDLNTGDFIINIITPPTQGIVSQISTDELEYTAPFNFIGFDSMTYQICQLDTSCICTEATIVFSIGQSITDCEIPSIITPNGDNMNEFFTIGCLADIEKYPNNELLIFNQWGDEVFRAGPYLNNWFGTWNNQDLPDGTYYYILNLGTGDQPMSGFLVIQR